MKKIFTYLIGYVAITGIVATGVAFVKPKVGADNSNIKEDDNTHVGFEEEEEEDIPLEPQDLMARRAMECNTIKIPSMQLTFNSSATDDVVINIKDGLVKNYMKPSSLSVGANVEIDVLDNHLDLDVQYVDNTVYVAVGNIGKYKITTDDFMSGVSKILSFMQDDNSIPSFELPSITEDEIIESENVTEEKTDFNIVVFAENLLKDLKFESNESNGDIGKLNLDNTGLGIKGDLNIGLDSDYGIESLSCSNLQYDNFKISMNALTKFEAYDANDGSAPTIEKPSSPNYGDLTYVFNLLPDISKLVKDTEFDFNISALVKKAGDNFLQLDSHAALDIKNYIVSADNTLKFKEQSYNFFAQYQNKTVYFDIMNTFKGRIRNSTIQDIVNLVNEKMGGGEAVGDIALTLKDMTSSTIIARILDGDYSSLVDVVHVLEIDDQNETITLSLNCNTIGIEGDQIVLKLSSLNNEICSLAITGVTYGEYQIDLQLSINKDSNGIKYCNESDYPDYAPLLNIYDEVLRLAGENEFAAAINLTLQNSLEANAPTYTFNGAAQFKFSNGYDTDGNSITSYNGYLDLVFEKSDKDEKYHVELIFIDNIVYATYFTSGNRKFKIKAEVSTIMDLASNLNTGSAMAFGGRSISSLFESIVGTPSEDIVLCQILEGNYNNVSLDLLDSFIVTNNENGSNTISISLVGKLLGLVSNVNLELKLNKDGYINNLAIKDLLFRNMLINVDLTLCNYNEQLENPKDDKDSYIDVKDIYEETTSLIKQYKWGATMNAKLVDPAGTNATYDIKGDIQFRYDNTKEGYYKYTAYADAMVSKSTIKKEHKVALQLINGTVYGAYNNNMNVKFDISMILDMIDTFGYLSSTGEATMTKISNLLKGNTSSLPILDLIGGEINADTFEYIKDFQIKNNEDYSVDLILKLDAALVGLASDLNITIHMNKNGKIESLKMKNLVISQGLELETLDFVLSDYNFAYEIIDTSKTYMDFTSFSTLIKRGAMNVYNAEDISLITLENFVDSYKIEGQLAMNITTIFGSTNLENIHFFAEIYVDEEEGIIGHIRIDDFPCVSVLADITKRESGEDNYDLDLYFDDNGVYIDKLMSYKYVLLQGTKPDTNFYYSYDKDFFNANFGSILLKCVFNMSDLMIGLIGDMSFNIDDVAIEDVLTSYTYKQNSASESFTFGLNVGELLQTSALGIASLDVSSDTTSLTGFKFNVAVISVLELKLDAQIVNNKESFGDTFVTNFYNKVAEIDSHGNKNSLDF